MILKVLVRVLFVVFLTAVFLNVLQVTSGSQLGPAEAYAYTALAAIIGTALVLFEWHYQHIVAREIVAVVFGMAAGLSVSVLVVIIALAMFMGAETTLSPAGEINNLGHSFANAFMTVRPYIPLIVMTACYTAITIVLKTRNDFRFLVPYIDFSQHGTQEGGIILDTSAIIDGRITEVLETRLVSVPVIIPDFVVRELQTIADSADSQKRLRGRRGLDMVAHLQKLDCAQIVIRETSTGTRALVDDELVRLAKELNARIVTTDFNLNKVSQIEGVIVINVNDLANAVKPKVIPGEGLKIKIIRAGQEEHQGVGYLDDGTMVVIEHAKEHIGETREIAITSSIQTSAGRMIFGKLATSTAE